MFEVGVRYRAVSGGVFRCAGYDWDDGLFFFVSEGARHRSCFWAHGDGRVFGEEQDGSFLDGGGAICDDGGVRVFDPKVFAECVASRIIEIIGDEIEKHGGDK